MTAEEQIQTACSQSIQFDHLESVSLKQASMAFQHTFDVQRLLTEQRQVPHEYRLDGLDQMMKASNILQSADLELFPLHTPLDSNSAWEMAARLKNIEELPFISEVLQEKRVAVWAEAIKRNQQASDDLATSHGNPSNIAAYEPVNDIRDHILLANLSSGEAQWLEHLNSYLKSYGIGPLDLETNTDKERLFRVKVAKPPKKYHGGPLVTVIMPVFNGEAHLEWAAMSVLEQSWSHLELIIVDDCSTDKSSEVIRNLAARDSRVKTLCTPENSGPYVAKNMALMHSRGDLITGHDADDWAHPCRIESQIKHLVAYGQPVALGHMLRMKPSGRITKIDLPSSFATDGILKKCSISAIFNADFFHARLGHWDNVRFAADSELIERAAKVLGHPIAFANILTMLCLDIETSLSNRAGSAIQIGGLTGDRLEYKLAWNAWHAGLAPDRAYLPIDQGRRYFDAPIAMRNQRKPNRERLGH